MMTRLGAGSRPVICLDFGRDRLSVVEVVDGAVGRWSARPLAEGSLQNGDPVHPGAMGEAVRQLVSRAGMQASRARMALPDEATVSRLLVLPVMPRRDLERAMHFAAERHLPFPIARARWSWDVVERTPQRLMLYLVATWRDLAEHYADIARAAGLVPEVLEPRALAVARAVDQERALLLDGGERRVHATLLVGGQPVFVDDVMTGSGVIDRREALDRLLQHAYRYQSTAAGAPGRLAPVLLAGDLETDDLDLPVAGRPISEVLNGQLPAAPVGFPAGEYLANLGLSMRP